MTFELFHRYCVCDLYVFHIAIRFLRRSHVFVLWMTASSLALDRQQGAVALRGSIRDSRISRIPSLPDQTL